MSALDKILTHYEDAISNWHDPWRSEAIAKKEMLDKAREELAELRRMADVVSNDEFAISRRMWYNSIMAAVQTRGVTRVRSVDCARKHTSLTHNNEPTQ